MRFVGYLMTVSITALVLFTSFEIRSWSNNLRLGDNQNFIRFSDTQSNVNSWKKYLKQEIELVSISKKILRINIPNIMPEDLEKNIKNFEVIKYAKLYNLEIISDNKMKLFNISATITLP